MKRKEDTLFLVILWSFCDCENARIQSDFIEKISFWIKRSRIMVCYVQWMYFREWYIAISIGKWTCVRNARVVRPSFVCIDWFRNLIINVINLNTIKETIKDKWIQKTVALWGTRILHTKEGTNGFIFVIVVFLVHMLELLKWSKYAKNDASSHFHGPISRFRSFHSICEWACVCVSLYYCVLYHFVVFAFFSSLLFRSSYVRIAKIVPSPIY